MKRISAKDAKNHFGLLLDCAMAEPVEVQKHGRPVMVVMSVEAYRRPGGRLPESGKDRSNVLSVESE